MKQKKKKLCLAQRKGESKPCQNPDRGCPLHCGSPKRGKPGEYCAKRPMSNGRCERHGGRSLFGAAHPNFKHGRDSKYLLARLQGDYERTVKDETLLDLVDEIAMTRALAQEIMDQGGSLGQILAAFDRVRRLVDTEHKHRIDNGMAITPEQLATEIATVAALVRKHLKDEEARRAFLRELDELTGSIPSPLANAIREIDEQ